MRGRIIGSDCSGTHTSSSLLAKPHKAISEIPNSFIARCAALTCGAPPSTTINCGGYANLLGFPPASMISALSTTRSLSNLLSLRVITWCIARVSSKPSVVSMMNRRYSLFLAMPSSKTTIEATTDVPEILEISKHSIRSGVFAKLSSSSISSSALPETAASLALLLMNCTRA